jgi:plastocyanin
MRRPILAGLVLTAAAGGLAACGTSMPQPIGSQTDPLPHETVLIVHQSVIPRVITVKPGTTVTWSWDDGVTPDQIVFPGFGSPIQARGSWRHTFSSPGVYSYRDPLHFNAMGEVVVSS